MKRLTLFSLLVAVLACTSFALASLWSEVPLYRRILASQMVAVGRLANVRENSILVMHSEFRRSKEKFLVHLDTGTIEATTLLYRDGVRPGSKGDPATPYPIRIAWTSKEQPQNDSTSVVVSSYFAFDEGDEGIWILDHAPYVDHWAVTRPDNFLPLDSLDVVRRQVEKVVALMDRQ